MDYEFVPVKDHQDLVRDPLTNGIINTNHTEYEEYITRRDNARIEKEKSYFTV